MFISDDSIQKIKDSVDIVDLVGNYLDLKKAGKNFKATCPFHQEKTPSFIVSPDRQTFKCFGCGESGDIFTFVEKMEHVDFPEALRRIADRYQIPVEAEDPQEIEKKEKREKLYRINRETMLFYYKNLLTTKRPQNYLSSRNMQAKVVNPFMLGYADGRGDSLYQYLKGLKYKDQDLLDLGLIAPSHSGKGYYDMFRNRLIFPILNLRGQVLGFGGRIIGDGQPKYLNSKESEVFQKGKNLYGIHLLARQAKLEKIVMVEGYMDVVGLYQTGIDYALASLGTSLTLEQAKVIGRYSDNIFLCYDGDSAGIKASRRAVEVFKEAGIRAKLILLPDGMDPDDYAHTYGREAFEKEIEEAVDPPDFELRILRSPYDLSKDKDRLEYAEEATHYLATIEGEVIRDIYIQKVAEEANVPEDSLRKDVLTEKERQAEKKPAYQPSYREEDAFPSYGYEENGSSFQWEREDPLPGEVQPSPLFKEREELEKTIIRRLALGPVEEEDRLILKNFLKDPARKRLEELIHELWKADLSPAYSILKDRLDKEDLRLLSDLLQLILSDEKGEKFSQEILDQMNEEIKFRISSLQLKEEKAQLIAQLSLKDEDLTEKGKSREQILKALQEIERKLQNQRGRIL